jgi:hypothetical protein
MRFSAERGGAVDVYPVGLFSDINRKRVRYGLRHYLWSYCIKGRRWRAARNYFNGYLAEHEHGGHNAGRGWTKRAALRRVDRICRDAS